MVPLFFMILGTGPGALHMPGTEQLLLRQDLTVLHRLTLNSCLCFLSAGMTAGSKCVFKARLRSHPGRPNPLEKHWAYRELLWWWGEA